MGYREGKVLKPRTRFAHEGIYTDTPMKGYADDSPNGGTLGLR